MSLRFTVIAVFIIAAMMAMGCTGQKNATGTGNVGGHAGRVISPDQNWPPAGDSQGSTQQSTNQPESTSGSGGESAKSVAGGENGGSVNGNGVIEKPTITIQLLIDGKEHPLDQPILVHDNEQVMCEFHFTATVSELKSYAISNAAQVSIKQEGEISGLDAKVPYVFTFISRLWRQGGIKVTVANQRGDVETKEIDVMLAPAQRFGGR